MSYGCASYGVVGVGWCVGLSSGSFGVLVIFWWLVLWVLWCRMIGYSCWLFVEPVFVGLVVLVPVWWGVHVGFGFWI